MNNTQLIVLKGIPCSGKSSYARKILKTMDKTIIVNRDSICEMVGDYWVPAREPLITEFEMFMIKTALSSGYSVIVDATNLNPKTLAKLSILADTTNSKFETVIFKILPLIAFLRSLKRAVFGGRFISYKVIKGFYNRYESIQLK